MPWCPNCQTEYREGILKCTDCGADLVSELVAEDSDSVLCYLQNEQAADKLVAYLAYSGIESMYQYDPDEDAFMVVIKEKDKKRAIVEYKAFLTVEGEAMKQASQAEEEIMPLEEDDSQNSEASSEEEYQTQREYLQIKTLEDFEKLKEYGISDEEKEDIIKTAKEAITYKPAGVYHSQSEKANDYSSTGYTFIIIGAAMFIFTALNLFGVIPLLHENTLALIVLFALSIAACGVGIGAFKRSKKASSQIAAEENQTKEINEWMETHKEIMTQDDLSEDADTPDEILYLKRTAVMKTALRNVFGNLDDDYIDSLIDDFYNKCF
ncbi:MAG: hypothetical protein IKP88_10665 [Lachnospiraceae bacterium]|nr:hypothetical protein [Lachnospiraceae bacterium]